MSFTFKTYSFFTAISIFILTVSSQGNFTLYPENTITNLDPFEVPAWLNSSNAEYERFIKDKYNYFITTQGNKFWVGTMNMAWNEMKRNFLEGKNATFFQPNLLQQHMIDNLNSEIFTKDEISEDAYYISSGFGQSAVNRINFEVREKFPLRTLPDLDYQLNPEDFISYSYLFKNFKFANPFNPLGGFNFKGTPVNGFKALTNKQKKQVYYKYYNGSRDFMIGIETQGDNDEIILWKTDMEGVNTEFKIEKLLKMFYMFYNLPSTRISRIDQFEMPVVNLDLKRSYKELLDLQFTNEGYDDYVINKMDEKIKLQITRFGVELEAESVVQLWMTSSRFTKYFILNSDFWVFLKEKNKQPYLISLISKPTETWTE